MRPRGGASNDTEAVPASMSAPSEDLNDTVIWVGSENTHNAANGGVAPSVMEIS